MRKFIVTADIEVHTAVGDVSSFEIRKQFESEGRLSDITDWIDSETDRLVDFIVKSLGVEKVVDNTYVGVYAIKKNIVLKPVEEV